MKPKTQSPKLKATGFTLVELLVGLTIIGLIFAVGFNSYRAFARRQQLSEAGNLVKSDLLFAQQKALSGEKPASCTGVLNGYLVIFESQSAFSIYADCDLTGKDQQDPFVKTVNLSSGVTKTSGPDTISFKILGQGTNFIQDEAIVLTQTSTGQTTTIIVTQAGSVN